MSESVYKYVVRIQRDQIPKELVDSLKKFYGLPPFEGSSNYVKSDALFYNDIINKYGAPLTKAAFELLINPMIEDYEKMLNNFNQRWS